MSMRSMRLRCPNPECRTVLRISAGLSGRRVKCSCCGRTFKAPDLAALSRGRRKPRAA